MAFPPAAHVELGLLRAIVEAGGVAMKNDPSFYRLIALYFPEINEDDLMQTTTDAGKDLWTAKCQQLFLRMAKRYEIEGIEGDTLEITDTGLARLGEKWLPEWGPNPILPPPAPQPPLPPEPPPPGAETPPPGM